jgi:hypothetical protein
VLVIKVLKVLTQKRQDWKRTSPIYIIFKTLSEQNKKIILQQYAREEHQVTYKGKSTRITADLSKETLKARKA